MTVQLRDGVDEEGDDDQEWDDGMDVTMNVQNADEPGEVLFLTQDPRDGEKTRASLRDPDGGTTNLVWQWSCAENTDGTFEDIGGATQDRYTPTADEAGKYLRATVEYSDDHGSGKEATGTVIRPVGVDNLQPSFSNESTELSIDENSGRETLVGNPLDTVNPDFDRLTYALIGQDATPFKIDRNGQITVAAESSLNHEGQDSHSFSVTLSDRKDGDGIPDEVVDDTMLVTVNIQNVDEAGFVILQPNPPLAATSVETELEDQDGETSGVTWQWAVGPAAHGPFTDIEGATQERYAPIRDNVGKHLRATANYTDPQGSGKTASEASQPVEPEPVTNQPPSFGRTAALREVPENTAPGRPRRGPGQRHRPRRGRQHHVPTEGGRRRPLRHRETAPGRS